MMKRSIWLLTLLAVAALIILSPILFWRPVSAHGGVIIDGGFTDHYEWIAMASPFPVTPGETILSIVIYDIETYAPINGLVPALALAPPDSPRPCCQGDGILGPLSLLVDPELYPGDYSNITLLLQEGTWQGKFTIDESDPIGPGEAVEIFFDVEVRKAEPGEVRETPIQGDIIALTATAVANGTTTNAGDEISSAANTETENASPTTGEDPYPVPSIAAQNNPAPSTPYPAPDEQVEATEDSAVPQPAASGGLSWATENVWLLAALVLVPILLIVFWLLWSSNEENE